MAGDTCERSSTPLNGAIFDRKRLQQLDDFGAVLPLLTGFLLDSALLLASHDPSFYAEDVACPNLTNNGARVTQMSRRQLAVDTSLQQLVDDATALGVGGVGHGEFAVWLVRAGREVGK
ncbi:hypothetical protein JG688_00009454 [Phytophthora aleatoria]|uniref:Uncharacterized protein n=1 Tax=Phytophthora aleatoria TaxID=2496075 RepID=A0A8J5J3F1_9STRA|nr:hypothetical protein JG688_00009454 [Phytophthora aleatoria]